MKKILTIGLLFCFLAVKSQDAMNTNWIYKAEFKYEISAKTIKKRFDRNGTEKQIIKKGDKYYINIEIGDNYKKFKILGVKFYCLPRKIRKEL